MRQERRPLFSVTAVLFGLAVLVAAPSVARDRHKPPRLPWLAPRSPPILRTAWRRIR